MPNSLRQTNRLHPPLHHPPGMHIRQARFLGTTNTRPFVVQKVILGRFEQGAEFCAAVCLERAEVVAGEDGEEVGAVFGQFRGDEFCWEAGESDPEAALFCRELACVAGACMYYSWLMTGGGSAA